MKDIFDYGDELKSIDPFGDIFDDDGNFKDKICDEDDTDNEEKALDVLRNLPLPALHSTSREQFKSRGLIPKFNDEDDLLDRHGLFEYTHFCGYVTEKSVDFSCAVYFKIRTDDCKTQTVRTSSLTELQVKKANSREKIHVIANKRSGVYIAKIICTHAFYKMFSLIEGNAEKLSAMSRFLRLDKDVRKNIETRLGEKKYSLVDEKNSVAVTDKDILRLKYDMCRNTFTPSQQREIDTLFSQRSGIRSKVDKKLEYILNISSVYHGRKKVDRKKLMAALDSKLYKMDKVKNKLCDCITSSYHTGKRGFRILLAGSSGTGKTTIAKAVAQGCGLPFDVINLNGVMSAIDIKGIDASYDSADCGKLVKSFYGMRTTEGVVVLDEIDKMGTGGKDGNPADALLDCLSDHNSCYDAFLEMALDTTNTVFIATANSTENIPDYLLNRFDVIHIDDYTDEEKCDIGEKYFVPEILCAYKVKKGEIVFTGQALEKTVSRYCSDRGVRMLKENIRTVVRKILVMWDECGKRAKMTVTERFIEDVLEGLYDENDVFLRFARNKDRLDDGVRTEIRRTLDELNVMGKTASEKEKIKKRAGYLTSLIPDRCGFDSFDRERYFASVNATHYGLDSVKEQVSRLMCAKALSKNTKLSSCRILLAGPAGTGKSTICKSIADGLGIPYIKISLGGVGDEAVIKGFSPTYVDADAGEIVKGLSRAGTTNALIQLDEIDKTGSRHGVNAGNALLDLLDNCNGFADRFLGVPIDLSDVLFVATANDISNMESWLCDRFDIIHIDGYTKNEKKHILTRCIIPSLCRNMSDDSLKITVTDKASELLVSRYCTSMGVRDLEKAARRIVTDKLYNGACGSIEIDEEDVVSSLGALPIQRGNLVSQAVPGFSKALAVSGANSGMAFSVETVITPDEGATTVTGLPKESTLDSVKIAKTYVRLNYMKNKRDFGLHLHFGEGAVVKDGPSAGTAIAISILSAVSGKAVCVNAAYTGEIDLFGNVFAIGGALAKIQAAEMSGCSKVFIPRDNYERLSEKELEGFTVEVVPVSHISQIIGEVLPEVEKEI